GETNSVITTIAIGYYPLALVWNSADNKVYCANGWINTLKVIDGATNSIIKTIRVGDEPFALFWNSITNKVYCANLESDNVTVIDGRTDSVITTIAVGDEPRVFCWNSIQNRVYVANYASSSISVIRDVTGIEEDRTTPLKQVQGDRLPFEIYPNPAKSVLAIRLPLSADRQAIKIFDVSGTMVREIEILRSAQNDRNEGITRNDRKIEISLKGINPGIYFLKLGNQTKKFLVVK
ncbi:MAG: T9SS type A sorting domain-containing protein, partial [candidate division WOR-3 bacterium]